MESVLFTETQRFRQTWLWGLLLGSLAVTTWGVIQQVILGIPWGTRPAPDWVLVLIWMVMVLINWGMAIARLDIVLSTQSVYFRFFPFHQTKREIAWADVLYVGRRRYAPIREFGGYGIRWGAGGKAFNTGGNQGLQLVLKNRKRLLLGIRNTEGLDTALAVLYEKNMVSPL